MNWKEQFDGRFRGGNRGTKASIEMQAIKYFISTEIIEKLIADIPEHLIGTKTSEKELAPTYAPTDTLKQQLIDKWLQ